MDLGKTVSPFGEIGSDATRVLVVDTNHRYLSLMVRTGRQLGFEVIGVDPKTAFDDLPDADSVDVALMNYDLGPYTALQIATLYAEIPTIIYTKFPPPSDDYWRQSIQGCVPRHLGPRNLLDRAREVALVA